MSSRMISSNDEFIDPNNFERQEIFFKNKTWELFEVIDKRNGKQFNIKVSYLKFNRFSISMLVDLSREIDISSRLLFPSIIKYYGYSPVDFENKPKPMILFEFAQNKTLDIVLHQQDDSNIIKNFNDTKKLIIIYGITSAMSYLHSKNIVHRDLRPENVFLDKNFYPKLFGFNFSKELSEKVDKIIEIKIKGTLSYLAPEILTSLTYSKSSDVYSFGLLIYELITNEKPFENFINTIDHISMVVGQKKRPDFKASVTPCYKQLIEKCWSENPSERPTFDQILSELKTNDQFITEKVDREEFHKYVKMIEDSQKLFAPSRPIHQINDLISKSKIVNFESEKLKTLFDLQKKFELSNCEVKYSNHTNRLYEILDVVDKETQTKLTAKCYRIEICNFAGNEILNLCREVNVMAQLNHPSILKFIGYSPVNFKGQSNPVIVTEEYNSVDSLSYILKSLPPIPLWNDTKKLICIYGIASAMAYLHFHSILHRDLKPENIYLDSNMYPKVGGFHICKQMNGDSNVDQDKDKIKGTPAYLAPEVYSEKEYSIKSDVYSYSMIIYEIIIGKKPFIDIKDIQTHREEIKEKHHRPLIDEPISESYRSLLERCWSEIPTERPTFSEIVEELEHDKSFITDTIDEHEFRNYIEYIAKYNKTFEPENKIDRLENIANSKLHTFTDFKISAGLMNIYQTESNDLSLFNKFLKLDDYEIKSNVKNNCFFQLSEVENKKTGKLFMSFQPRKNSNEFYMHEVICFTRELNALLQLNHPSILKFVGYSPYGFFEDQSPLIFTQYVLKQTLNKILKKERKGELFPEWNDTKKLIIIYGIASAMAYLHAHGILHRDLKPENIYLDSDMYPKLGGFYLCKQIDDDPYDSFEQCKIKGTPAYLAPEVYSEKEYSIKSDVYSYSMIIYEIIIGKKPFIDIKDIQTHREEIKEKHHRPLIDEPISESYRSLLERCWSEIPTERPTFSEIVEELEHDKSFITDTIDEHEFRNYIEMIQNSQVTFNQNQKIQQLESFVKLNSWRFEEYKSKVNFKHIYETELNEVLFKLKYVEINEFEKQKKIDKNNVYKLLDIIEIKTGKKFLAQIFFDEINEFEEEDIDKLTNELYNITRINHPSFTNFVGYSPKDFKGNDRPVILTENCSNGSLEKIIKLSKEGNKIQEYDETKKLILIYGIASAMSYLHSKGIIHCRLCLKNILLDDFLFPKITGFYNSLDLPTMKNNDDEDFSILIMENDFTPFDQPEVIKHKQYSKASDVYSFGKIVYSIISNEIQFENYSIFKKLESIYQLPEFEEPVDECYKALVYKCCYQDPQERPTFEEIVLSLKNNKEFITEKINQEEYQNYIKYLDQFQRNNSWSSPKLYQLYDPIESSSFTFRKIQIDFSQMKTYQKPHFSIDMGSIDLSSYTKDKKIGSGGFGNVYKAFEKQTGNEYAVKVSIYEIDQCSYETIIDLSREVEIISQLNHPSVLNFIGYSPSNFKNKPKPVILTEFAPYGSLSDIIELERNSTAIDDWNDTKKLINIYGIAVGMKYIHDKNIIHRDLKPANILLDEFLYPKIADFGLSKDLSIKSTEKIPIKSGYKGTYAYSAPEIIFEQKYSRDGDVYAYGMIVYEIITNEILFKGCNQYQLIQKLLTGYRPKFNYPIPYCYRDLITKCWDNNAYNRPTFSQIVQNIENNKDFITENVDEEEFLNYVDLFKDTSQKVEGSQQVNIRPQNDLKTNIQNQPSNNQQQKIEEFEEIKDECFIDLDKFKREDLFSKGDFTKLYKFKEIESDKIFSGQMSMKTLDSFTQEDKNKLQKDLKIISSMCHPALLKFVGYSPTDFKDQLKPVIVTEYASNLTLKELLELQKYNKSIQGWDETKKLINIYGIASAMSYLHSNNLIHRSLKPENIYLDDVLSPKIGDFGLSTRFDNMNAIMTQSVAGLKALPTYSAPEVLIRNEYSKASDVYAYSFIVYYIVTGEAPFNEISNKNQIFEEVVVKNSRPILDESSVPKSYRDLIHKCWCQDPKERMTFDDIVYLLKMDSGFLTDKIIKDDYLKYIKFVEENQKLIIKTQLIQEFDD